MKKIENICYGDIMPAQVLDIYLPDADVSAVFIYFHGGGLVEGDKSSAEVFAPYLTERGIAVVSANYRMYPAAKYPDFINDAVRAINWTYCYMLDELHCDKLFVGGTSAGGYISMMLCFDRRYLESEGLDNSRIAGYFHDAGQPTTHFKVLENRGIDPRRIIIDETAPLYYVGLEKEYPPMHFVVSDNDMVNRYEQTMLMLKTLSHFGHTSYAHTVMSGTHCSYCSKIGEDGESVFGKMIYSFIKENS